MSQPVEATYQIVRYRPELRDQVIRLQTHLWSPDLAVNAAHLEWKYERNPYMQVPFIHLAVLDGRVVGMRGMYGARWQIGRPSQTFLAPCAGDLVIRPKHRNRGLVAPIMEAAANDLAETDYPYAFNLSAGLATQLGSLTTGWRSAGHLETAVWRPAPHPAGARSPASARLLPLLDSARRRLWAPGQRPSSPPPAKGRHPFDLLDDKAGRARRGLSRRLSLERSPRPVEMAELIDRLGHDGRLRQVRDRAYFEWRFQNPLSLYRFFFWSDPRLQGYLVLQSPRRRRQATVTIVDWEATDSRVRADLLRAATEWAGFDEVSICASTLPREATALLRAAGFESSTPAASLGSAHRARVRRSAILVRAAHPDRPGDGDWVLANRPLLDLANWDLRGIYSDLF